MMPLVRYIDDMIVRLASREANAIDQARIRALVYFLFFYLLFAGTMIVVYLIDGRLLHLLRVSVIFGCAFVLFAVVKYTKGWKFVSHFIVAMVTLSVWSNILVYVQGVNIATMQYAWLSTALSFYMLGLRWGWFYSAANMLPILAYTIVEYSEYSYFINDLRAFYDPKPVSQLAYVFVLTYVFLVIGFLHYYFFKTFNANINSLTNAKNELNDLNEKLNNTLVDVRKFSNARMDFLSTMSHELRTPLNGVIGISNALLYQNPREDQKENLAILKFSAENLLSLINDILDFNKLDSDKAELERIPFNLVSLIKNSCASVEMKAREKMLDLNLSLSKELEGRTVFSDPTRLTQVLLNLLNNAIKFTESGFVSLSAYIVSDDEKTMTVHFVVEDSGIGINPDKKKYIFEPFTQASSSTNRQFGGTGLGLPIVEKVLGMFDTHIDLVSTSHVGTRFFFDIKFNYEIESSETTLMPKTSKDDMGYLKVLVAEDNAINILVIKKTLEQWGIVPEIAVNGRISIEKLEQGDYDVILMDLYMPEMDGYEAATSIRKLLDQSKANITIIALTATVNDNVIEKVKEVGMNDYLSKPFDPEHLYEKLQRLAK